ncbi:MAG: type II secretion system F family protein [Bacillota bacterium]|nr:type II secretion system F family protein [Bacillota bacterium]
MAPVYSYRSRDRAGKLVEGTTEAEDKQSLISQLQKSNLFVIEVAEKGQSAAAKNNNKTFSLFKSKKVKLKDLTIFSRQFATMNDAGMPMLRSLDILQAQTENKTLKETLSEITKDLERGATLSEAMEKFPHVFPSMYINMVETGEVGGVLEQVLDRMANYYEKEDEIREKVKSALTYPLVILSISLLAIIFMLVFILPTFTSMLNDLGVEMPVVTQGLINLSDSMIMYWYVYILTAGTLIFALVKWLKTPAGKFIKDRYLIKMPIFGDLLKKVLVSRFSRTLSMLLRSGVPITTSLDVVKKTCNNMLMANSIEEAKQSIREGQTISTPLKNSGILAPMAVHMIAIGEETGELDILLEKISFFYDREVDHTVSRLSVILEPLLLVSVGMVIGGIVLSFMLPMFQVYQGF